MNRREAMLTVGGVVAALSTTALAQGKAPAKAADKAPEKPAEKAGDKPAVNTALIDAAEHCLRTGKDCLDHCVRTLSTGDKSMAECAATVRAMLPACAALADLARLNSAHLKAYAAVCAKICRDCEAACKKHANHHAECKACMESCQACATECEKAAA